MVISMEYGARNKIQGKMTEKKAVLCVKWLLSCQVEGL